MIRKNGNKVARLRRAKKSRQRICESGSHRLSVFKSLNHLYVQVITPNGDRVIKTISSNQKSLKTKVKSNNVEGSKVIGKIVADFLKKEKIDKIAFDRSAINIMEKLKRC